MMGVNDVGVTFCFTDFGKKKQWCAGVAVNSRYSFKDRNNRFSQEWRLVSVIELIYRILDSHNSKFRKNSKKLLSKKNPDSFFVFFLFFEFRSFRSITTIAGPGGVIGPLPRPNKGGRTTKKKAAKRPGLFDQYKVFFFRNHIRPVKSYQLILVHNRIFQPDI